ncbi:hypothetical protein ABZ114_22440 [Streptomyces albidoflavus]|uniref:hypothetical protein n=1 Tax=Streptomyces albidoflavus TaxID=1886 RepID=UPI0033AA8ADC
MLVRRQPHLAFAMTCAAITAATTTNITDVRAEGPRPERESVHYFAETPLPTTASVPTESLPPQARAQLRHSAEIAHTVRTDTPRGYKLRRGSIDQKRFIYKSAEVWAIEANCTPSECRPVQQVKLRFKQNVQGGSSKRWHLTMYSQPHSGPRSFRTAWSYQCGVNPSGETDKTCSTWKTDGSDGADAGVGAHGKEIRKGFGSTGNVKKFPMFKIDVTFADGSRARGDDGNYGEKFRGWDTCVKARSTKLCTTTGKGA